MNDVNNFTGEAWLGFAAVCERNVLRKSLCNRQTASKGRQQKTVTLNAKRKEKQNKALETKNSERNEHTGNMHSTTDKEKGNSRAI